MKTTLELSNTFSTLQKGIETIQPISKLAANLTYLPDLGPLGVIGRDLISDCAIFWSLGFEEASNQVCR